jgi:16S rRNA (cytosine967-C5)-methyltransferase
MKKIGADPNKISPARLFAFEALLKIGAAGSNAHSDTVLRTRALAKLSPVDRNLATTLVLGVLRWQIALDELIRPLLARPRGRLDGEVLIALRLGAFQLLQLDRIPAHAAINESVELTRASGHKFSSGMVNAVLRKFAASVAEQTLSPRTAHPAWLVERWQREYGEAGTDAICAHNQQQPVLDIRLISAAAESELANSDAELAPGELLTQSRKLIAGALPEVPESTFRLQDEGSQLVAEIAASLLPAADPKGEKKILDSCAAPGGKTLILAERLPQAAITAAEKNPARLGELAERIKAQPALASRIRCFEADATEPFTGQSFDLILADVPCSGTGTLGRNPEIRHRLAEPALAEQSARQKKILTNALNALRPGGRLLYSTCSLEPDENQLVVDAALKNDRHFTQLSLAPTLEALATAGRIHADALSRLEAALTPEGALMLLPGKFSCDGFFISAIERKI